MPDGRQRDRLGDAGGGRVVSPGGGDAAEALSYLAADQAQPGTRPKLDVLAKAREPDAAVLRRVVNMSPRDGEGEP